MTREEADKIAEWIGLANGLAYAADLRQDIASALLKADAEATERERAACEEAAAMHESGPSGFHTPQQCDAHNAAVRDIVAAIASRKATP